MIARVCPISRMPRTSVGYDYIVPNDIKLSKGSFVEIPFRNKLLTGVVIEILEKSGIQKLKAVSKVIGSPKLGENEVDYILELSKSLYQSPSTIFFLGTPLMKRKDLKEKKIISRSWKIKPYEAAELKQILTALNHPNGTIAVSGDRISIAASVLFWNKNKRSLLILVPDQNILERTASAFPESAKVLKWSGQSSLGDRHLAWNAIRNGDARVVVATRVASYTLPNSITKVIMLAAGEDDFFDQEQSPHIDSRRALSLAGKYSDFSLSRLCTFPRPEDGKLCEDYWTVGDIKIIDLKTSSRSSKSVFISDEVLQAISNTPPNNSPWIIYFNRITGEGYTANEIKSSLCAEFPGTDIKIVTSGVEIPNSGIAIITKTVFHSIDILSPKIRGLAILNADGELAMRGFRTLERAARTLRRLSSFARSAGAPIFIQTFDQQTIKKLLGATTEIFSSEIAVRDMLGYPPSRDIVCTENKDGSIVMSIKQPPFEVVSEWLTAPPDTDIITNPDRYDIANFNASKQKS